MKRMNKMVPLLGGFSSGPSLGGKLSLFRKKQSIYTQGEPASTLFYIQEGGVRLTTRTKHQAAVTAILGVNDFFGELCLAGYPLRMSTAVALTACSIRTIKKAKMLQLLRKKNKTSPGGLSVGQCQELPGSRCGNPDFLGRTTPGARTSAVSALDKNRPALVEIPILSHQVLAEMVGTTRPRINLFMNRFRKRGFISYGGGLEVHQSLRKVLRSR
jgi:CRP-like cAMP-binding protein